MPIREQQTTNKQHAIPQSIMSVEFKIIGDLTLKQFFFLMIFCGLAYASFMLVPPFIIKWLLVIFFVGTGLAFAFMPLGDRGLDTWVVNFLRAMFLANQFVYRKDEDVPSVFLYQNLDVLRSELITLTPTSSRRKIEAYLEQQEVPVDKLDIDEKSYILKVKEAYSHQDYWTTAGAGVNMPSAGGGVTTTVVEDFTPSGGGQQAQDQTTSDISSQPTSQTVKSTQATPTTEPTQTSEKTDQPIDLKTALPLQAVPAPQPQTITQLELPPGKSSTVSATTVKQQPATPLSTASSAPQIVQQSQPKTTPGDVKPTPKEASAQIIKTHASASAYKHHYKPQAEDGFYSPSMTPDMHAGRRFINLSQEAGRGEIVLPIRGERVLKSAQEQEFEDSEKQKIQDLDALINSVKSKELMQKQIIDAQKAKEQEEARKRALEEQARLARSRPQEPSDIQKELAEKSRLEEETRQKEVREREAQAGEKAAREQERLAVLRQQEEVLRKQKTDLLEQQRENEEQKKREAEEKARQAQTQPVPRSQPIPLQAALIDEAPTTPNIVWGLVTTSYENAKTGVPGVVVVIRNQKGEVVRAVKTSSQGKFGISTPLVNGSYTVEVDKEKKSGLSFAVTAVNAKGELIPTVEIPGKA